MPNDRTIIDVLEDVLGVPFDPRWTKQISIDMPTAHRLAQAVKTFYQAFRLPEKDRGEMRPYLTTSYKTGSDLLSEFVSFKRDQKFTPSSDAYLLAFLKPFLLYSHGISFYDPLPWLLDFFAHRSDADFIKAPPAPCDAIAVGVRQDCRSD